MNTDFLALLLAFFFISIVAGLTFLNTTIKNLNKLIEKHNQLASNPERPTDSLYVKETPRSILTGSLMLITGLFVWFVIFLEQLTK